MCIAFVGVAGYVVANAFVTGHERIGLHGIVVVLDVQHLKPIVLVAVLGLRLSVLYDLAHALRFAVFQQLFALIIGIGELQTCQF